jgi:hypothetical protein
MPTAPTLSTSWGLRFTIRGLRDVHVAITGHTLHKDTFWRPGGNRKPVLQHRRPPLATVPPSPLGAQQELADQFNTGGNWSDCHTMANRSALSDNGRNYPFMPVVLPIVVARRGPSCTASAAYVNRVDTRIVDQSPKTIIRLPVNRVDRHTAHATRE